MHFEEECELTVLQGALIGTMVMKWGWHEEMVRTKKYVRKAQPEEHTDAAGVKRTIHTAESDEFTIEYDEHLVSRPWIKYCDRRTVLVNRGCRVGDIRKAKNVVYRDYATYEDLDNLRGYEGYTIPDEDILKDWFMRQPEVPGGDNISVALPESMRGWIQTAIPRNYRDSADPLQNGLEILEYWSKDMVIVVLHHDQDNFIIRNEANPYKKVPFLSACWRPIPDCFDGQGIGTLTGPNQLVAQGITNMSLSLLDYGLNPDSRQDARLQHAWAGFGLDARRHHRRRGRRNQGVQVPRDAAATSRCDGMATAANGRSQGISRGQCPLFDGRQSLGRAIDRRAVWNWRCAGRSCCCWQA